MDEDHPVVAAADAGQPGGRGAGVRDVTLRDDVVVLRPFRPEDAPAVYAACQDAEIQRWTTVPSPYGRADAEHFVTRLAPDGWRDGTDHTFAVLVDGHLAASVGLHRREGRLTAGAAEIGYWLAAPARGRGTMTRAVRLVCGWGFRELRLPRIGWQAVVGNGRSRAVAERAGFQFEGVARLGMVHRGTRVDAWQAALLPDDPPAGIPTRPLPQPTLEAARLILRPVADDDVDAIATHCRDRELLRWLPLPDPYTRADAERFVRGCAGAPWERRVECALVERGSGALVGLAGLGGVARRTAAAEIGYWVAASARRRGYATEAVRALTAWGFAGLGLHRVTLSAAADNLASRTVARRAGFAEEGVFRDADVGRDDARHDVVRYARLAGDHAAGPGGVGGSRP